MMRRAMCTACCLLLLSLPFGFAAEVWFEAAVPIVEIEWRGKANMDQDEFLDLIGIQVGNTLQRDALRRSLERLYLKGFFSQIRIETTPVREGLKLTYYTTPAALVQQYRISGHKALGQQTILEQLRPRIGEVFSEHRLRVSLEALRQFYAEEGYLHATLTWRVEKSADLTRAIILLAIEEGTPLLIVGIRLEGVTAFSPHELLGHFKAGVGEPLEMDRLGGDLERLQGRYRRAGYLTAQLLEPQIERDDERRYAWVLLTVDEGPKITLSFTANRHLSPKVLREAMLIDALNGYSEDVLVESEREMLALYREQGFYFATMSHQVEISPDGREVLIQFHVEEGPQVTVSDLRISGNHTLSAADIQGQFLTQSCRFLGWLAKGLFIERQLAKDLEAVQFLYRRRGFLHAAVRRELQFSGDRENVAVHVTITEGTQTRVGAITIAGEEVIAEPALRAQLTLRVGDPLDEIRAQEGVERLLAVYERRGYRDARITLEKRFEADHHLVHLTYRIDEGLPTLVGDVIVQGNYRTQIEVITRELTFTPGDPLSPSTLLESRRKLSRMTLFSRIAMDPLLEEVPGERDVLIHVTERKPMSLDVGVGYGSEGKLRGFGQFTHNNAGMHRQFRARAQASFREQIYLVNLREPRLFGTEVSSTVGLSHTEERREVFSVRRISTQLGFEYPFWDGYRAFLTYSFDLERLFDVDSEAQISEVDTGRLYIASILGTFQRDTRDSIVDPHSGSLQRLSFEVADLILGSEVNFIKLIGTTQWIFPLVRETVGAVSLQGGITDAYGATGEVPISRRFFLGGSTTLRGYDFEHVGPTVQDGTPTGGDVFVLANLEWRVPVYKGFGVVLFTDIGNVFRALDDFTPGQIKGSVGLGLRYRTPIGPVRLDYGHKLEPERGEASGRFHFSIGQAF
jgi:outer membrane protein insertion porin family